MAIVLRQPIERPFGLHRAAIQDQPGARLHHPLGLADINGLATYCQVSRPRAFPLGLLGRRSVGLDRPLGRRGRRTDKPLDGLPLLVTERLPRVLDILSEPIDLSRLL